MSKFGHTISNTYTNTYHCWGRSAPWAKRAPGNGGERAPTLNLTQIDNLLRSCVHEIFVIVAIL